MSSTIAQFDGIDIPLVYSQVITREIIADSARTAGGVLRQDFTAVKRTWRLQTRPIDIASLEILTDWLDSIAWAWGEFWLDEFGPPSATVEAFLTIDRSTRVLGLKDQYELALTAVER